MKLLLLLKAGPAAAIFAASWMLLAGPIAAHAQSLAEALDTTNLTWTTGGDAPWSTQTTNTHDGVDAVRSGTLGSNQTSWIETTVVGPATISFWVGRSSGYASWYLTVNGGYPGAYFPRVSPPGGWWYQDIRDLGEGTNVLRWTVFNYYGSANETFVALDEVTVDPPRPLAITSQPHEDTVYSGGWASLYASAVGTPPLLYQWRSEGTNILGATNSWLWFDNATTNDSGIYSVVVSNAQAFVVSSNAVLTVLPPSAPFFTQEPTSRTVYSGEGLSWWAGVNGSPPFAYQWRKDGTNIAGATNYWLEFESATPNDSGVYSVVVSNAQGFAVSRNATLTVLPPSAPFFTREPASTSVYSGHGMYWWAAVNGSPPFAYQWRKDGTNIAGATNYWLEFESATTNDSGIYTVVVSNAHGSAVSRDAVVTILPPSAPFFTQEPASATAYPGQAVTWWAGVNGSPPFAYQWRKDGTGLPGATETQLRLTNVSLADAGNYSVVVTNAWGHIESSNAVLTVLPPSVPFFTSEPTSRMVYSGQSLTWWTSVNGSPPFAYQWRKDGTNIAGATNYWLGFESATTNDAGLYSVVVSNALGFVVSSNAAATVLPTIAPVIIRQPRSLEVAEGVSTWLSVEAEGAPDPSYDWVKVGTNVPAPPPDPLVLVPPVMLNHDPSLWLDQVTADDAGLYRVTVANVAGQTISREALLTVLPPLELVGYSWRGAEDLFVTNHLAYLAQGSGGLAILDFSEPSSPLFAGSYNTAGTAMAVQVANGFAFVADGSQGLQIISITNVSTPVRVGGFDTSGSARDVVVRNNLAFVADGDAGLLILDISNPAAPFVVGSYATNVSAYRLCLAGNLACVASPGPAGLPGSTKTGGLLLIDVSNPAHPAEVGRLSTPVWDLDVGDHLVFAAVNSGVQVVDVSDPAQPRAIQSPNSSTQRFTSATRRIRVVNGLAYVITSTTDLFVLDVRDPREPVPVASFTTAGSDGALWVDSNRVYLCGDAGPLFIIDTPFDTHPAAPPSLTLSTLNGLKLQCRGRRGLHYVVEFADEVTGSPWRPVNTIMLTNETAEISVPAPADTGFFRLRQVD